MSRGPQHGQEPHPPARWRTKLFRSLPAHIAEEALRELDERYRARVEADGAGAAARWYRVQARGALAAARPPRRPLLRGWLSDFRLGARKLVRRPAVTAALVLTLALGIGANAAIFSVVSGVLLRPLPYPEPDRLVMLWADFPLAGSSRPTISGPELLDLQAGQTSFDALGAAWFRPGALTDDAAEPEDIGMAFVSADLLPALGVAPAMGRLPAAADDAGGEESIILLSHHLWERRYGSDPEIVGSRIEFDGVPHTVIGVMAEGFQTLLPAETGLPERLDAWVPFGGRYDQYPRGWRVLSVIARLAPGVGVGAAEEQLAQVTARMRQDNASDYAGSGLTWRLEPLADDLVRHVRPLLLLLLGAVGLMLLIVCANSVNLIVASMAENQHELAVRTALGATRRRLFRQLAAESLLVVGLGAAAGIVLARWGVEALPLLAPEGLPRLQEVALDWRVLGYVALISAGIAMLFGTISALHLRRQGANLALRAGARSAGDTPRNLLRQGLVVLEVALCLMLLVGVGLLTQSFAGLLQQDPGYAPEGVSTLKVSLVDSNYAYAGPDKIARYYRLLEQRLAESAGIDAIGATTLLPLDGDAADPSPYAYETSDGLTEWGSRSADYRTVTPGFFAAVGARLLSGRLFTWDDDLEAPNVVVLDETMAAALWPEGEAVGQRLQIERFFNGEWAPEWAEVIGVVAHMRQNPARVGMQQLFVPHAQMPMRTMTVAIRSDLDPDSLMRTVAAIGREVDPDQPVQGAIPMVAYLSESVSATRFAMTLLGLFSGIALVLAVIGTYGVISYAVTRRTRELGIRMALGAAPGSIRGSVLRRGAALTGLGIVLGLVGAASLSRFLAGLLYGVGTLDATTFAAVTLTLAVVGLAACYLPARRASRLDPTSALRAD